MFELALHLDHFVLGDALAEVVVFEGDALHRARRVLKRERSHARAALGGLGDNTRDHAHERGALDVAVTVGQVADRVLGQARDEAFVRTKRMVRDVDLHDLLLEGKKLALGPFDPVRSRNLFLETRIVIVSEHVEHADLALVAVALTFRGAFKKRGLVHEIHQLLARVPRRVERTALDKGFERLTVIALGIQAVHEIMQRRVRAVGLALGDDGVGNRLANAAHANQTEADVTINRRELGLRRIDVGRQNLDARLRAACDIADQLVGCAHVTGKNRRHVFRRVMCFQVCRAHDQQGICSRVRLIECVLCEFLGVVPNFLGDLKRVSVLDRAVVPVVLKQAHDIEFLLTHCLAQFICLTGRKAAHDHGHLHDLLLVDHGAIRLLKNGAKTLVVIVNRRFTLNNLDVVLNHAGLQRARAIKRDRSDDVRESLRRDLSEQTDI